MSIDMPSRGRAFSAPGNDLRKFGPAPNCWEHSLMNRKQRRAALKQGAHQPSPRAAAAGDSVPQMLAQAAQAQAQQRLDEAARFYRHALTLEPEHAQACNNLGCVLQAQGKLGEASACFARSIALVPQLLDQFAGICATLQSVLPPLARMIACANAA